MSVSFFAENNSGNEQLWITDGTVAGTRMVKAFAGSSILSLTMVGAKAYFTVDDGVHGNELWSSDGTAAGTMLVSDISPRSNGSFPTLLTDANGTLFFAANDGVHGFELWKSDGTAPGTLMVKDINPGADASLLLSNFAEADGSVFFTAFDFTDGIELWKSDGTAAGTVMVKDINPGLSDSTPQLLTNVDGTLFFTADDGTHGFELWRTDGTEPGTMMVKDIDPGATSSIGVDLTNVNGTAFFSANDLVHGRELWKSDGTAAGTMLVKDINSGAANSAFAAPGGFVNVNGTLFFDADDGVNGPQLWKSDGTAAGTVMVKLLNPGSASPEQLTNVNGRLEFYAFDGTSFGLFKSDGTAAGTIEIATHVDIGTPIGVARRSVLNDLNGDRTSDMLWRNSSGALAVWNMNDDTIASSGLVTSAGAAVNPGASWSVAGTSDFNGDGQSDILWRSDSGGLAEWLMKGTTITSSVTPNMGGAAVTPDSTWSTQTKSTNFG